MRQTSRPPGAARGTADLRTFALEWAHRGRPVFPARLNKAPYTPNGLLDATTDPEAVQDWWRRWPGANVALRTGEPSRLVVLDVDGHEGADALHALERDRGGLPVTTSVKTPRGGHHFYFEWPGAPVNTTAGAIAPGLDVRADGGYVLVPPSRTEHGKYEWDAEVPPAPMPPWLHEMAGKPGRPEGAPPELRKSIRDGIPEGSRNAELTRLTGYLLRRFVPVDLAADLVGLVNQSCCRPPLPECEVDRIIDSIAGREWRRRERAR